MLATKQAYRPEPRETYASEVYPRSQSDSKSWSIRDRVSVFTAIAISAASFWMLAMGGAQIDRMNYNIDTLQSQVQKASAENASLTAQVDELSQPARILNIALNKLHMQYKNPVSLVGTSGATH